MIPCYVAAPYAATLPEMRAWNVARAELLGELVTACGLHPVVVHRRIHDHEWGPDEDPASRAAGVQVTLALCLETTRRGLLWVLERDDGEMSPGTQVEVDAATAALGWDHPEKARWLSEHPRLAPIVADGWILGATWHMWRQRAAVWAPHLLPRWDALAALPRWTMASMLALRAQVAGVSVEASAVQRDAVLAWRGVWSMAPRVELGEASAARRWQAAVLREIDLHDRDLQTTDGFAAACMVAGLGSDAVAILQTRDAVRGGSLQPRSWHHAMVQLALQEAR